MNFLDVNNVAQKEYLWIESYKIITTECVKIDHYL